MEYLAERFIKLVKEKRIEVKMSSNIDKPNEKVLSFSRPNSRWGTCYDFFVADFPDVWESTPIRNGSTLLLRSNGFATQFVSHNPRATYGGLDYGICTTVTGKKFDVTGGWSSRAGIVNKYTKKHLAEIIIDNRVVYIDCDIAKAIAHLLNLTIGIRTYKELEETIFFFKEKELNRFEGFSVRYGAMSKNKARMMTMYGCDGTNHAIWKATEWLNSVGEAGYAVDHGVKVIGKCTGTCKGKGFCGGFDGDNHPQ